MFEDLKKLSPQNVFLVQGTVETFEILSQEVFAHTEQPQIKKITRFVMEEAKDIVSFNLERKFDSWYVAYFDIFVPDAAQVLLKTLEEPREGITIVFVTPHPYLLPQTILSRVRLILNNTSFNEKEYLKSKKTLKEYIKENIADEKKDPSTRRSAAILLLDDLEQYFKDDLQKINSIYQAKDMLLKANMPTKQVVEYLVSMVY